MAKFGSIVRNGLLAAALCLSGPARAQPVFDPRQQLAVLIQAFQQCVPSPAFQVLAPLLWNIIYQQTGGSGCYPQIAGAGPVVGMQVIDSRQLPLGPVYAIRVTHAGGPAAASGPVDWFIGFNQYTGKVEYLTFQNVVSGQTPSITAGPSQQANIIAQTPQPTPTPAPVPTGETAQQNAVRLACANFATMCPRD